MRNNFLGLKNFVESKYPDFQGNVFGEVYPPSAVNVMLAQLASYVWLFGIVFLMGGSSIFQALGIPVPELLEEVNKNKVAAFVFLFVVNSMGNSLVATGAFEIYVNEELIFSKLESGRFPNADELIAAINALGYKAY
jgi:selT/selW/selH-like putative selenoprotein